MLFFLCFYAHMHPSWNKLWQSSKRTRIFRQMFQQFFLKPNTSMLTNSNFWRKALLSQTLEPGNSPTRELRIETDHRNVFITMQNLTLRVAGVQLHGLVCHNDLFRVSSGSLSHSLSPLRISLSGLLFSDLLLSACAADLFVSFFCSSLFSVHPALYSRNFFAECAVTVRRGMVLWGTQQIWDALYSSTVFKWNIYIYST